MALVTKEHQHKGIATALIDLVKEKVGIITSANFQRLIVLLKQAGKAGETVAMSVTDEKNVRPDFPFLIELVQLTR